MKKLHKNLKLIMFSLGGATLILGIGLSVWVFNLNEEIKFKLQNKKFLPPTEYYTAPLLVKTGMKYPQILVEKNLRIRAYTKIPWGERLQTATYSLLNRDECEKAVPVDLPEDTLTCLFFHLNETADLQFKNIGLQMIAWGENHQIVSTLVGNPLAAAESVVLEPFRFAQYLNNEPVVQRYTPLGQIPTQCLQAVVAIEDNKFLEHSGVSITGILRAVIVNLVFRRAAQGGSTITQQMVKNYFLTSERTIKRKLTEFFMSLILETQATKDEIFETYLNIIYLGQNGPFQIRGFPAASEYFFSKPISQIGLRECSLLAAVLNSPGLYDPFKKAENAKQRRDRILDKMKELQMISESVALETKALDLGVIVQPTVFETAPFYLDAVQKELLRENISPFGLKIYTGLDLSAQEFAQSAVNNHLAKLEKENKKILELKANGQRLEGALLSVNNQDGSIQAIVGGRNFRSTQFNRATDGHRQIGSIMKPFVFLAALLQSDIEKKVYSPTTILNDERFTSKYQGQTWTPENYGKKYFGAIPMFFALKSSLNCATASLGLEIGLDHIIEVAQRAGITSQMTALPSLTLGSFELYPLEVLQSYMTLARFGKKIPVHTVRFALNENSEVVYRSQQTEEIALPPEETAVLVSMMKQTLISGTAQSAAAYGFDKIAAGKTGTTSDNRDSWFAGFTPQTTTVAWVGYDNNVSHGLTGSSGAVPIWADFMKNVLGAYSSNDFDWPETVRTAFVPSTTENGEKVELKFKNGTEPKY